MKVLRTSLFILLTLAFVTPEYSCRSMAKAAAKHWTKRQVKKFKKNCKSKLNGHLPEAKVEAFCGCATDKISQSFDLDKANQLDHIALLKEAASCLLNK